MFQQSSRIIRSLPPFHLARRRFNMATTATNPIIAAIENKEYEKAVDMILEGSCPLPEFPANPNETTKYKLVIHGGAGTLTRGMMTADKEKHYRSTLTVSLLAGQHILHSGGNALDAACAAVMVMEDSPLFNAGKTYISSLHR